jgi:hypothetical protein
MDSLRRRWTDAAALVRVGLAATLMGLLAGCDGIIDIEVQVLTPEGRPAAHTPVYVFLHGQPDEFDAVKWTGADGRLAIHHTTAPTNFDIELIAVHPDYGIGRLATSKKVVDEDGDLVVRLGAKPVDPDVDPDVACMPNCGPVAIDMSPGQTLPPHPEQQ